MPLFLSEEEFRLLSHDPNLVAEKADEAILDLRRQIDTAKAEADAASIVAEQTYNFLEQRYASLSAELTRIQSENASLSASAEKTLAELAESHSAKHELHVISIGKDGEIERLKVEVSELHKSKRQLLELLGQKDEEIGEKNATIQSYLDKIVKLTENATQKESRLHESEAELARGHATCARLCQEKELIEKHNEWLNEELTDKVNCLAELRKTHLDFEADMSIKLADVERKFNESSRSLKRSEERVKEYSMKVSSMEEELISCKNAAATTEEHYAAELSTVTKLVELYKESSEEWSKKAGELGGVIKALEAHLSQVENVYKEKLEKEISARKDVEKEAIDMKEKLHKCEVELEQARKSNELRLLPISSLHSDANLEDIWCNETEIDYQNDNSGMLVPKTPLGISGTALAASLLRDGWSLAKMYEKYHEAADAQRHERWGRKHSEAILERVLHEIEQKAEIILEERAEHEKMVEAYTSLNQKLQQALSDTETYERTIRTLKAELKRHEREYTVAQKEISDLEKQVTVLLKECRDAQIRSGGKSQFTHDDPFATSYAITGDESNIEQLTYKDINELVQQNVQLRSLTQSLSSSEQTRVEELKESFQMELQKKTDEAAAKVEAVLKRCEEQACMIDSLHTSVAMYKRIYEDQNKNQSSSPLLKESVPDKGRKNLVLLFEESQDTARKAHEQLAERVKCLEDDLTKSRNELMLLRLERDKISMEATFAKEKLDSFMKEFERQRDEANGVSARNVELTTLLVDYQRRLRESTDSLHASGEHTRRLSVEVSVLKNEKEVLINSEKRASDEIHSLTERVRRLQSSLDTIQSVEELREEARSMEIRKLEEYIKRVEKEWAEAKKELQDERDHVRMLKNERERAAEDTVRQVEQIRRELSDAWRAVSSAESSAAVAEARLSDFEALVKSTKTSDMDNLHGGSALTNNEANGDLWKLREQMEKLKEEAEANKGYMIQYKEIARTNESALKQMESTYEQFKVEADTLKNALEAEILSLKEKISELENECILKSTEAFSALTSKEDALSSSAAEIDRLKEENSEKLAKIMELEAHNGSLKDAFEREHERWHSAHNNYERQVILQSETIQELDKTSRSLASLQDEVTALRQYSDTLKADNEVLKASLESEKSVLSASKEEVEKKYKEIDEQNKILHNRLEALHIKLTDKELSSTTGSTTLDASGDNNLQSVINYLRRAKEIAYTEVTLVRQEKLRLQSQLDSALKASERAQALVQSERANAGTILFTDEEFKSLQLQVREINLLRESNAQLREENKHNFEESQKFREMADKAKMECSQLAREKDTVVEDLQKEIEVLKAEKSELEQKLTELLQNFKNIDAVEYERLKDIVQQNEENLREKEVEIEATKNLLAEKQEGLLNLERELAECRKELDQQQKKISDFLQAEVSLKADTEKQKRIAFHMKKRVDILIKDKEGLTKENQNLVKQIEDSRSGKRIDAESTSEEAIKEKEKDTRIQMLEKTLEREREDLRKEKEDNKREKSRRIKTENSVTEHLHKIYQEKKKLEEEIRSYKQNICTVLENIGITASQLPSDSGLDEQSLAYFFAVGSFEEAVNSGLGDGLEAPPLADPSTPEVPIPVSGQQFNKAPVGLPVHPDKSTDQKEKGLPKLGGDARKTVRKIVRPRLEQSEEPAVDIEMPEVEVSTATEGKVGESHEPESHSSFHLPIMPPPRKRLASSSVELKEESTSQYEPDTDPLPLKKSKGSESFHEGGEGRTTQFSESSISLPPILGHHDVGTVHPYEPSDDDLVDVGKDDKLDDSSGELQEQPTDTMDGSNQDDEVKNESDTILEFSDKPMETVESFDEMLKGESQEPHQPAVVGEDDREEGEFAPAEQDLQLEEGEFEGQQESISGDAAGIGVTETDEGAEIASAEDLNEEKNDASNIADEVIEASDKSTNNDQSSVDCDDRGISLGTQEPQNVPADVATMEQVTSGDVTETNESQAANNKTIVITERAREKSLLRQAGMMTRTPTRGRGRASGRLRRDTGLGGRGGRGRGGRGQASGDREQG